MKQLLYFIEHSLTGAAQIFTVTVIATLLHFIVQWSEITESVIIIYGLKGAEYLMFVLDMCLISTHLLKSFKNLIREIWKS